jgi:predicted outer membrane repeat protein
LTGEEQDVFPLEQSHIVETVANDLVTDEDGNIYVLFSMNTGQIAIHQFSQNGVLLQRFGKLLLQLADTGGGMYNDASSPTLNNVTFSNNTARINGGGIYNLNSNPTLTEVSFSGN